MKLPAVRRFKIQYRRFEFPKLDLSILVSFLTFFTAFTFLFVKGAAAQVPQPAPVPCNQTNEDVGSDDEFHTFRPYQSSPCNPDPTDLALFCGNDLVIRDSITVRRDPDAFNCYPNG